MAKGYKYVGPGETIRLSEDGPVYKAGEMVPDMTDAVAESLVRAGHWIEGMELPSTGAGETASLEVHTGKSR